jgi:hypothetical protein
MRKLLLIPVFLYLMNAQAVSDRNLEAKLEAIRPYAKNGSCGWVALYISQYLTARKVPHEVYVYGIGRWENIHVMIRCGNGFIDKYGYHGLIHLYRIYPAKVISPQQLQLMLSERWRWNRQFAICDTAMLEIIKH